MKKTLMALAVGAAFAAPSAFADVTISGAINMGPYYMSSGKTSDAAISLGGAARDSVTSFGVATNYSNVTISSTDDIAFARRSCDALVSVSMAGSAACAREERSESPITALALAARNVRRSVGSVMRR